MRGCNCGTVHRDAHAPGCAGFAVEHALLSAEVQALREDLQRAIGPMAKAAASLRMKAALESLRARCMLAARDAVRHSQQTTDQCRAEVAAAIAAVPLVAP